MDASTVSTFIDGFYKCRNCNKKFKTEARLLLHFHKSHINNILTPNTLSNQHSLSNDVSAGNNPSNENNPSNQHSLNDDYPESHDNEVVNQSTLIDEIPSVNQREDKAKCLFYLCPERNCNRKYKKECQLIIHCKNVHGNDNPPIISPVSIEKRTKIDKANIDVSSQIDRRTQKKKENRKRSQIINNNSVESQTDNTCIVCMEGTNDIAMIPCGHKMFCKTCSDTIYRSNKRCPYCRAEIVTFTKIYN